MYLRPICSPRPISLSKVESKKKNSSPSTPLRYEKLWLPCHCIFFTRKEFYIPFLFACLLFWGGLLPWVLNNSLQTEGRIKGILSPLQPSYELSAARTKCIINRSVGQPPNQLLMSFFLHQSFCGCHCVVSVLENISFTASVHACPVIYPEV